MKSISILGTSSNAGKSWVATALCAWLKEQGVRVAPFKAQNMSNNAYATMEGGEIGVAQAIQAEACGLRPIADMNPILLKPSAESKSQVIRLGEPGEHISAQDYYSQTECHWRIITDTLDRWKKNCDVLVMEGAGSPVELNLSDRDIVNLKPVRHLEGKWILVADIERGGSFAQVVGTWELMPEADKENGLGFIVNKFRGDPKLFADAGSHFEKHLPLAFLGTLPFREDLGIEDEDSLNTSPKPIIKGMPLIAWVRFPKVSNSQDQLPWQEDQGIQSRWVDSCSDLENASAIILPGSKSPISDLEWMKTNGMDEIIQKKAGEGVPVVGICGGYQMLGQSLDGVPGLSLLPVDTTFSEKKLITRTTSSWKNDEWETFEIHTGETVVQHGSNLENLLSVRTKNTELRAEGVVLGNVWGTYQHGLFDSPCMRERLVSLACLQGVQISNRNWKTRNREIYAEMGQLLENTLDMEGIRQYLGM